MVTSKYIKFYEQEEELYKNDTLGMKTLFSNNVLWLREYSCRGFTS